MAATSIAVTVTPETGTVRLGNSIDFNSSVNYSINPLVTWLVNDVPGGNATLGTINGNGLYTAPATMPGVAIVLKAVSKADATKFDTARVTLQNPIPVLGEVRPSSANTDLTFEVVAQGTKVAPGARIVVNGTFLPTTISGTELRASYKSTAAPGTKLSVWLRNPDPGAIDSVGKKEITLIPPVSMTITPTARTIRGGASIDFGYSIANAPNKAIEWYVKGVKGGNATVGTIDENGIYRSPIWIPSPNTVEIKVVSVHDRRAFAAATVTLENPLPVISGTTPTVLKTGGASISVTGTGFAKWAVLNVDGKDVVTTWLSPTQLQASPVMKPAVAGYTVLRVKNPDPGGSTSPAFGVRLDPAGTAATYAQAAQFLESAAFGPDKDSLARVMEIGKDAWINEQFQAAITPWDDPPAPTNNLTNLQRNFFRNAIFGNDQLRQRVSFALSQIFVVSGIELYDYWQMVPYVRLLNQHAFGNYFDLMKEMALSPSMGEYLDMVNNEKPNPVTGRGPNENWARELLQLFTMGLYRLNVDGSRATDAFGKPVSTYSEDDVAQLSLAFTGWTYPPMAGAASQWKNPKNYYGRMVAFEDFHDRTEKNFLGQRLNAGQTAAQDLDGALRIIFEHPNLGPFVSYRLIQRLVTGNPSSNYVARVAVVFNNNGSGVRGDLKAVVRAILTDPEADSHQGQLREPVVMAAMLFRGLGMTPTDFPYLDGATELMGQDVLHSPSVFSYFSPFYRIPGTSLVAPEFQVLNPATALARLNFFHRAVNNRYGATVNFASAHFESLASNPEMLLDAVDRALLRGQMQADMRAAILPVLQATTDLRLRVRNAIYLVATSSRFQVKR